MATNERTAQRAAAEDGETQPGREASYRMKIGGMSCSFCTATIRRAYERINGVREVGVSLAHEEGLVKYDPDEVTPDELRHTLEQVGYTYRDPDKVRSFEEEEAELRLARNRLLVAATLTLSSFLVMLFGMWLKWVAVPLMPWIMLALALETMFVTAWFVKRMAFQSLRGGILNQHVLLEFGAFAGLVGGLLGLFVSGRFPAGDFFAVATLVTTCHLLSDYASKLVRTRSSQALRQLMELRPDTVRVIRDGQEEEAPVDEVEVGEGVRIRPGESIPVDGQVVDGASAADESLVTGGPIPVEKVERDEVIGGSVNQTGTLVVEVTRVGEESFLSQIARSIEEARALRPGVLPLIDTVSKYYVPGVLIFAAVGFAAWTLGPLLFGGGPNLFRATFAALAVLVLGYPCALGMATPLAMIRGGAEAARQGILMRSGEAFQMMGELRTIVLDKTGTITCGEPSVQEIVAVGERSQDEVLQTAASAESVSEHPLARAIEQAAEGRGLEVTLPAGFQSHAGKGVEARVEGAWVLAGKPGFLEEQGIELAEVREEFTRLEERGLTVVGVARDGALVGVIGIGDAIKGDAAEAIQRMKYAGMTQMMITGDNRRTARAVAEGVGTERVLAEVLPEDKAAEVRELQDEGQRVAMVGDGINDAPALAQADVGIAIGAGTDIAIESADIVIMSDRLGAVMDAYDIGMRSYRRTKQNLGFAFAFNGIGVPAATTGFVHPVWAMIAMVASVTLVLGNSFAARLLRRARGEEPPGGDLQEQLEDPPRHEADREQAPEPEEHEESGAERARERGSTAVPEHKQSGGGQGYDAEGAARRVAAVLGVAGGKGAADPPFDLSPAKPAGDSYRELRLEVLMPCDHCAQRVEDRLGAIAGIRNVTADHQRGVVAIRHTPPVLEGQIRAKLHQMGFYVTGYHTGDQEKPS